MKQIFLLSKENVDFSKQELLSLVSPETFELFYDVLIIETENDLSKRLAFTHSVFKFLFRCDKKDVENKLGSFDWQSIFKDNFCVRVNGASNSFEKIFSSIIWHTLKNPKVNLVNSKTEINFFFRKEDVICGLKIADVDKSFYDRWPHKRPAFHPTSITSKLARAAVNLAGLKEGTIFDPFCGSGAILIEAGMMGFKVVGSDLNASILKLSKINLDHYGIKNYDLSVMDATKLPKELKFDAIVCDPPYGRNVIVKGDLSELYVDFMDSAHKRMKKGSKLIMICPKSLNVPKLNTLFEVKSINEWFIHNSLTRQIVVFVK